MRRYRKTMFIFWGCMLFLLSVFAGFLLNRPVSVPKSDLGAASSYAKSYEVSALHSVPPVTFAPVVEEIKVSHYLVRLKGSKIAVYAYENGKDDSEEVFLYNIDVRRSELTDWDIEQLEAGIVLYSREDLASFEEDFSS